MTASLRWLAPLTLFVAALSAWAIAPPGGVRFGGSRPEEPFLLLSGPSEQSQIVQRRVQAKNAVTDRLLEGDLTLAEAASWFRYLCDNPPQYATNRSNWPGDSEGEKLCRHVINWVSGYLSHSRPASEIERIVSRLEEQLCALLARGDVELPW